MAENLEQEFARLEQEYNEKRAALEKQKESGEIQEVPPERETMREMVTDKTAPSTGAPAFEVQKPSSEGFPKGVPSYEVPGIKEQVDQFVAMAFKNLEEAAEKVRATHNPAIIDAFHDALVDIWYDQLVEEGKIKGEKRYKQAA